jgi:U3 small nucleolar RNA-associated protein 25
MQNIEHLTFILDHLNHIPKESHGCDFSRVRDWYLDGNAKYLRQTIMLSAYITPELNSLSNRYMLNNTGKLKYQPSYTSSMLATDLSIKQIFSRFESKTFKADHDARFAYFTSAVMPWILKCPKSADGALGLVIVIPSYFDYVRVRNYFSMNTTASSLSWAAITENKGPADRETLRARSHFVSGRHDVLLYTGRAHHFYRYAIRGVRNVVFYQLPDNPLFYKEMVQGWLSANVAAGRMSADEGKVRAMFSKWDGLRLERIVGTERVGRMASGSGETFEFS